jgi:hypothetical protein
MKFEIWLVLQLYQVLILKRLNWLLGVLSQVSQVNFCLIGGVVSLVNSHILILVLLTKSKYLFCALNMSGVCFLFIQNKWSGLLLIKKIKYATILNSLLFLSYLIY